MPSFGVFEDGELIVPGFVNEESAEQYADQMRCLPLAGAGTYEVKQLCPEPGHEGHGVDDCSDSYWLHRVLDALKR